MTSPDWCRWYPSKYAQGVIGLMPEQRGVYMDVINIILDRGSCPEDYRYLTRVCNCRVNRVKRIIGELVELQKLRIENGEIVQERAQNERRIAVELTQLGHSLAVSRWSKRGNSKDLADAAPHMQTRIQNPEQEKKERKKQDSSPFRRNGAAQPDLSAEFDSWWSLWSIPGTKVGKEDARKAYRKARKEGASAEMLADAIRKQIVWWQRERREPRFCKSPAAWLNGQRWEDDLLSAASQPARRDAAAATRSLEDLEG